MLTFHSLVDDAGTFKLSALHRALSQQWPLQTSILLGTTLCHPPPCPPPPADLNDASLSASLNYCDFLPVTLAHGTIPSSLLPCSSNPTFHIYLVTHSLIHYLLSPWTCPWALGVSHTDPDLPPCC